MKMFPSLTAVLVVLAGCSSSQIASNSVATKPAAKPTSKIVSMSEVEWEQLNPKRGDKSPKSATLWGDRTGPGPSGFLLRPVDGFSSPPHIHTASYHGVVIGGTIHNAEPSAKEMYLPPGSFWTQPGGGEHITACKGTCLAYIEVEGAFDVLPVEKARNNKAKAINLHASSINWVDLPGMPVSANGSKVAVLWGQPQDNQASGTLVKLPAGSSGMMHSHSSTFHAVVIQGRPKPWESGDTDVRTLELGTYFSLKGPSVYQASCESREDCIFYVRSEGKFDFFPARLKQ